MTKLYDLITGKRAGWGPIQLRPAGEETILKTLTIPAGFWAIWAPIRIRWSQTPAGVNARFGVPDPEPLIFEVSDHDNVQAPNPNDARADTTLPIGCLIKCAAPTKLTIVVIAQGDDAGHVVDGDSLRIGVGV